MQFTLSLYDYCLPLYSQNAKKKEAHCASYGVDKL